MSVQTALGRGARAGGLALAGSAGGLVLQLVSVVVLSRLLGPDDFGVYAMVGVFIALGTLLRDFGMPMAALQSARLSHQQASNLFWVNVGLAGGSALVLALSTPLLVALYSEPRLAAVVPVSAVVILLGGVGAQVQIGLARNLRFAVLVASDLVGQAVGLTVAIALARCGVGYWALVAQSLVATAFTLLWRWVAARWRPVRFRRGHDSARLFRAGSEYGAAYLLTFAQSNADTVIVGAVLGADALGFYNRAYQILTAPASRLLDPLTQVVVPTLQRCREEGRQVNDLLARIQFLVAAIVVWAFAVAYGCADRLVPAVLGPGWDATVAVFKILAIGGAIAVFNQVSYWAFIVHEQSRALLRYNLVSKPLSVVFIVIGSGFGLEGVAWGYVAAVALSWPLNLAWLARCAGLPWARFARNGVVILSAGLAGGLVAARTVVACADLSTVAAVGVAAAAGTLAMLVAAALFPSARRQVRSAADLLATVRARGEEKR